METVNSAELAKRWFEYQQRRHANPDAYRLKSTGLPSLDHILGGGIELGQLVYIGGAQKSGKSTLLLRMAKAFALQKVKFVWFGAEMTNMQIGSMLFSNVSGIERTKIRRIGLEEDDWRRLDEASTEIESYPGYWNYGFSLLDDIDKTLDAVEKDTGELIEAVFVDYIQLMESPGTKGGRSYEIEAISRGLKHRTLQRTKPMAVIAAAQLNRESIRGKILDANAFLGSGSIERDMDIGMIIHNVPDPISGKDSDNIKEIVVVGSRETAIDSTQVAYNGSTASIEDNRTLRTVRPEEYWK